MPLNSTLATVLLSVVLASSGASQPAAQPPSADPAEEEPGGPPESGLDAPPGDVPSYDAAIRASSRTAETLQGPLEGSWVLTGRGRRRLYRFQLADHGLGPGTIEGAWRDLRLAAPGVHSGLLSNVARDGGGLVFRFEEAGDPVTVTLRPAGAGWGGLMRGGGRTTRVSLKRG